MKKRPVYPVEGRFLQGVPHVPHDCDDPHCTESGAFTTEPPPAVDEPEAAPASESQED